MFSVIWLYDAVTCFGLINDNNIINEYYFTDNQITCRQPLLFSIVATSQDHPTLVESRAEKHFKPTLP